MSPNRFIKVRQAAAAQSVFASGNHGAVGKCKALGRVAPAGLFKHSSALPADDLAAAYGQAAAAEPVGARTKRGRRAGILIAEGQRRGRVDAAELLEGAGSRVADILGSGRQGVGDKPVSAVAPSVVADNERSGNSIGAAALDKGAGAHCADRCPVSCQSAAEERVRSASGRAAGNIQQFRRIRAVAEGIATIAVNANDLKRGNRQASARLNETDRLGLAVRVDLEAAGGTGSHLSA